MKGLPKITEDAFQSQVIALARLYGWKVAHFRSVKVAKANGRVQYMTPVQADGAGFPDLILIHARTGRIIAAELKVGARLTKQQQAWLDGLKLCGLDTRVWRPSDWEEIKDALA